MHNNIFRNWRGWTARVAERNAALLAQQAARRRGVRTPEVIFPRHIDNSRLVKAADPVRARQMRIFAAAATVLFTLIMVYGLQHFSAIEAPTRSNLKSRCAINCAKTIASCVSPRHSFQQPGRIDGMARQLGMAEPQPGQVVHAAPSGNQRSCAGARLRPPTPLTDAERARHQPRRNLKFP
jgi:hypothetical protein